MTIRTTLEDADEEAQPVGPNFTPALSNRVGTNRREYMYRAYHPDRETVATSEASAKHSEEVFSGSFSEPAVGSGAGAGAGAGAAGVSRRTYSTITNTSTRDTVVEAVENYRSNSSPLRFGIINTGSPAFAQVMQGWDKGCREYGVSCYYVVSNGSECLEPRTTLLREYIEMGLDGIALKPCDEPVIRDLFEEANAAGIPVITFDSDVTNSTRDAFIGTDNVFVGNTLARLLRQLRPEGGTFCFVGDKEGRNAGFRDVITKYNNRSTSMGKWYEVPPAHNAEELQAEADWIALMEHCASHNPTGMVILYQSPMRNLTAWEEFVLANQWRNITYIGVDAADYQLDLLNRRLVDGLVGQLPYEIGELAVQVLFEKAMTGQLVRDFYPTNLVSYNLIPIQLPPITVDQHLLGNLTIVGYTCFAVIAAASIACAAWTRWNRAGVVVKAAQPIFLHMVAGGTILLSSALVPLSMDISDELFDATPMSYRVGICMSIPWLAFTGLTIVFAALFTKTWRVTRLFKSKSSPFSREQIAVRDVLAPFAGLLFCNIVVLYVKTRRMVRASVAHILCPSPLFSNAEYAGPRSTH
jgi:ABC-type sugar transport system substrate-binding protein